MIRNPAKERIANAELVSCADAQGRSLLWPLRSPCGHVGPGCPCARWPARGWRGHAPLRATDRTARGGSRRDHPRGALLPCGGHSSRLSIAATSRSSSQRSTTPSTRCRRPRRRRSSSRSTPSSRRCARWAISSSRRRPSPTRPCRCCGAIGQNATRLNALTEQVIQLEGRADDIHNQGAQGSVPSLAADPMAFIVGSRDLRPSRESDGPVRGRGEPHQ